MTTLTFFLKEETMWLEVTHNRIYTCMQREIKQSFQPFVCLLQLILVNNLYKSEIMFSEALISCHASQNKPSRYLEFPLS